MDGGKGLAPAYPHCRAGFCCLRQHSLWEWVSKGHAGNLWGHFFGGNNDHRDYWLCGPGLRTLKVLPGRESPTQTDGTVAIVTPLASDLGGRSVFGGLV